MSEIAVLDEQRRPFFTDQGLAKLLAVSDRTVRDWRRGGLLAYYELGGSVRIDPADVDSFLAERRREERRAA